jgi:hypothetical protein
MVGYIPPPVVLAFLAIAAEKNLIPKRRVRGEGGSEVRAWILQFVRNTKSQIARLTLPATDDH